MMIKECYSRGDGVVERQLTFGECVFTSTISDRSGLDEAVPAWSRWWRSYLRGARPRFQGSPSGELTIVDLFCGCGGLTLGVREAALAVGLRARVRLAVDTDAEALSIYGFNLQPDTVLQRDVASLVDFQVGGWGETARFVYRPLPLHRTLQALTGSVDLVVAGPPCEGHSNLNNRTRRTDPRNLLYLDAIATAVAIDAHGIVLENVPAILNDSRSVLETAVALLESCGYRTSRVVLTADRLGLAQTRQRFFLVASRNETVDLEEVARALEKEPSDVRWAIEDLVGSASDPVMDSTPALSAENRLRINYLFDNNLFDLPDQLRPICHQNGHTYPSVYGRLRWDRPSGTITTGFMTPGRGRFVHPSERRTLTSREAARLQGFPDWFEFRTDTTIAPHKNVLGKCIGDAVPPSLGYAAVMALLPAFLSTKVAGHGSRAQTLTAK